MRKYYETYWEAENEKKWKPSNTFSNMKEHACKKWIQPGSVILDLGCGEALYPEDFTGRMKCIVGLDIALKPLTVARKTCLCVCGDLENGVPFKENTFDAVLLFEVLEHLFHPEETLEQAHRILKPEGILILTVPNIVHFWNRVYFLFGRFYPEGSPCTNWDAPWKDPHIRFFTEKTIRKLLHNVSFNILDFLNAAAQKSLFPSLFVKHFLIIAQKA